MNDLIRFIGVNKDTTTAGPGKRLEFFTKGCIRGVIAPCQGCFNEATWTFEGKYRGLTIDEVVDICDRDAWNRQVTFCGGEPILQARALSKVSKQLKEIDPTFHFVMYTAYKLDTLMKYGLKFTWVKEKHGQAMYDHLKSYSAYVNALEHNEEDEVIRAIFCIITQEDVLDLMEYIDLIVDGDYQNDKRLTNDQYMHEGWFIGSANQRVIFGPKSVREDALAFVKADFYNEHRLSQKHCKSCGHTISSEKEYCNDLCKSRHDNRKEIMSLIGGI